MLSKKFCNLYVAHSVIRMITSKGWSKKCNTHASDEKLLQTYGRKTSRWRPFGIYSNIYPTRCNVTRFILSGNCSTCFGWYHHPSSGAQTTVSTASGICHTVIATCRYHGRVGTQFHLFQELERSSISSKRWNAVPSLPR